MRERRLAGENPARYGKALDENHLMGYARRTERQRLALWVDRRKRIAEPYGVELYDLQAGDSGIADWNAGRIGSPITKSAGRNQERN